KSAIKNVNNENIQIDESQQMIVADPLRLKSSSVSHYHKELAPHAINLQSSSLGMPFSNIDLNSHVIDNNTEELCHG
ncbi:8675_t:CDS:2, partial [Gigaspora margarita]